MTTLRQEQEQREVMAFEEAAKRLSVMMTTAQQLEMTRILMSLRTSAGLPARLAGPSGTLPRKAPCGCMDPDRQGHVHGCTKYRIPAPTIGGVK